jgi:hypothetical protein
MKFSVRSASVTTMFVACMAIAAENELIGTHKLVIEREA